MEQSDTTTTTTTPPSHPTPTRDPTKITIDIPIDNRGTVTQRDIVISSAVKKPSSLIADLLQLLSQPKEPMQPEDRDTSARWTLEASGDAITRTLAFGNKDQARLFCEKLGAVSDEMDHHAHVTSEDADGSLPTGDVTRVRVTCTTHRPRGLSMRDMRLARRVDELARALG